MWDSDQAEERWLLDQSYLCNMQLLELKCAQPVSMNINTDGSDLSDLNVPCH